MTCLRDQSIDYAMSISRKVGYVDLRDYNDMKKGKTCTQNVDFFSSVLKSFWLTDLTVHREDVQSVDVHASD